jgi:hypothetical protein
MIAPLSAFFVLAPVSFAKAKDVNAGTKNAGNGIC